MSTDAPERERDDAEATGEHGGIDMEVGEKRSPTRDSGPSLLSWAVQPVVLLLVLVAIVIYINTANLNSLETRNLNSSSLFRDFKEHMELSVAAAIVVILIAVPLGVALTRGSMRRYSSVVMAVAGFGQAAPAIGLIVLAALVLGIGKGPVILALAVYGILPVLANVVAGIDGVDQRLVEAGRGMGMSAPAVLVRVELAMALPVIMTGLRTALVLMVGTASLAGFAGGGGLGSLINTGISLGLDSVLVTGAILVAVLALFIDWLLRVFEYVATPKGLR